MDRTHLASIYRKAPSLGRTSAGRPKKPWGAPLVTGLPGNLQATSSRLVRAEEGKRVEIVALYFVHPDDYPAGVAPRAGDALVVTEGAAAETTYMVHAVEPQDGGPWDDELQLVRTAESVP